MILVNVDIDDIFIPLLSGGMLLSKLSEIEMVIWINVCQMHRRYDLLNFVLSLLYLFYMNMTKLLKLIKASPYAMALEIYLSSMKSSGLNLLRLNGVYVHQWTRPPLVQIIACCLLVPNYYLNQCWLIVNLNLGNNIQWHLNHSTTILYKKMEFNISSTKWRPFCPKLSELNTVFLRPNHIKLHRIFTCVHKMGWYYLMVLMKSLKNMLRPELK